MAIREWHDANGIIRFDQTREGTIESGEQGVVSIRMNDGTLARFDLQSRRLL